MATVKEVIEKAYTKVNGEYEALIETSDDFKTYLNVLNQVMEQWVNTPYVYWQSLFDMTYELPDIVANGVLDYPFATVDLDRIHVGNTPFDSVFFVDDDGVILARYKMTDQAAYDASEATNVCMMDGTGLHFKEISTDLIGAKIKLPVYKYPPVYTSGATTVRIDSLPWLVTSMAAFICDASPVPFIARNADKFYKEAAIYMKTMRANNRHRQHLVIKSVTGAGGSSKDLISLIGAGLILGGGGTGVIDGGSA